MNQEMSASNQLRAAARLVERATDQLNVKFSRCAECGREHHDDMDHKRAYDKLANMPSTLLRLANVLEGKDEEGREIRRSVDAAIKGGRI